MNELLSAYYEDIKDMLIILNDSLLKIDDEDQKEVINTVFRVAHTIKGNSSAMKFTKIEEVMHMMEDILQQVRSEKRPFSSEIKGMLYDCHDFIEDIIPVIVRDESDQNIDTNDMKKQIMSIYSSDHDEEIVAKIDHEDRTNFDSFVEEMINQKGSELEKAIGSDERIMLFNLRISDECIMKAVRVWLVLEKANEIGTCLYSKPASDMDDSEDVEIGDDIFLAMISQNTIEDIHRDLDGISEIAEVYSQYYMRVPNNENSDTMLLNNDLDAQTKSKQENGKKNSKKVVKELIIEQQENVEIKDKQEETKIQNVQATKKADGLDEIIRVPLLKIDNLVDMLGELIILNSRMEKLAEDARFIDPEINNTLTRMEKILKLVQNLSISLRLVEIKPLLHRLSRVARDTAKALEKDVKIILNGEGTEIDRNASEQLFDPLMHLVRNAVSHGIETKEERKEFGKNKTGTITISSYSKRGFVYIDISDDGAGIDLQRILDKAIEKGFANTKEAYSDDDIIQFIFKPGFSTTEVTDKISGRGVGMNVVEDVLKQLNGRVSIKTVKGVGTTMTVRIPMNLAVMNATIILFSDSRYIIPTLFIKEFIVVKEDMWIEMHGKKEAIRLRDLIIPVIYEDHILGVKNPEINDYEQVIILEMEQKLLALPVKQIIGRKEVVVKPLDEAYMRDNVLAGAAIMGDGKVSLILDVETIFKIHSSYHK